MFSFSTLLQYLLLLLLFSDIYSFPSSTKNLRYERAATSSLTKFPESGEFVLVLQNDESLEFEMCCNKSYGCNPGSLYFCFETFDPKQSDEEKNGCGYGTCAYKLDYEPNKQYSFSGDSFSTSDTCLNGKISKEDVIVMYLPRGKSSGTGCPLDVDVNNHLKLFIQSIPSNVTVTALNAKKYVEPTTTIYPLINATESSQKEDEGMSDGVKYTLIGIGILLFVLILGGIGYGIYRWRKSQKSSKPVPKSTVSKAEKQTDAKSKKPTEQKEEGKTKEKEHPKVAPSTVVSSAEPQKPSKEPTPSAEPHKPHQVSHEPLPSAQQQRIPAEIPNAPPTLADLVTRAERNGKRAKMGNTFDKTKKPFYENVFDSMLHCKWISEDDLPEQKKEKHLRPPSEDEILLFSLPIGDMFVKLEIMIDQALKRHKKHDEETPCKLITNPNVTYFVSHMAIVIHFAKFFKVQPGWEYSIPLSLAIAMDRTQSDAIRRHSLVVMVQRAVNLLNFFTELECLKLPYPMNVLCLSFQYNRYLPQNVHRLHTFSSPNNSECTKSDGRSNGKHGTTGESIVDRGDGKEGSSSSKLSKATTMSKEIVVEKKKKGTRKR